MNMQCGRELTEGNRPADFAFDAELAPDTEPGATGSGAVREERGGPDRYRCLFDSNSDAVFLIGRSGRFVEANAAAERLIGYSQDELRRMDFAELCVLEDRHKALFFFARAMSGASRSIELSAVCRDGSCVDLFITGALVNSGGSVSGIFCTARDVTRQRRANAQMRRARRDAEQARDRFLSILSHELRTPLMPVLTLVQMLEKQPDIKGELHESLAMMRRNLELESRLIDDLLDLNRIRQGKLTLCLQQVDLHQKLDHVLSLCAPELERKQITVRVDAGASNRFLQADAARMNQVLWTIIGNATKFTPENGEIHIVTCNGRRASACPIDCGGGRPFCRSCETRRGQRLVAIHVTDSGVGISPNDINHLFEAFGRSEHPSRDRAGSCISLSISKALVELHGGQMYVHSRGLGKGTTFTVILPAEQQTARRTSARRTKQDATPPVAGRTVLLVEDHPDTARVLARLLKQSGFVVDVANSVKEALCQGHKGKYDLLISDIGLPDGTGLDVVRHLRAKTPIPAVALSGYGMEDDIRRSREAGFAEHLVKPINIEQLQGVIQRLLHTPTPAADLATS